MGITAETAVICFHSFQFVAVCDVVMAALKLGDATSLMDTRPSRKWQKHGQKTVAQLFLHTDRGDVLVSSNQIWDAAGASGLSSHIVYVGKVNMQTMDKLFYKMCIILDCLQTMLGISQGICITHSYI